MSCPRLVNASDKSTQCMHHSRRRNVTTSMVGLKTQSQAHKISPKRMNPRDIAKKAEEEEEESLHTKLNVLPH